MNIEHSHYKTQMNMICFALYYLSHGHTVVYLWVDVGLVAKHDTVRVDGGRKQ